MEKNLKDFDLDLMFTLTKVFITFVQIKIMDLFNLGIIPCTLNMIKFIFCVKLWVLSKILYIFMMLNILSCHMNC